MTRPLVECFLAAFPNQMKEYLIETFRYNDYANKLSLAKINELKEKDECVRLFSHLINSMNKWLGRVEKWGAKRPFPEDIVVSSSGTLTYVDMDWWLPVYSLNDLEAKWDKSLEKWLAFLESKTEGELIEDVEFVGFDGSDFAATAKDIALQLNYHSIHHRAQIQYLIRQQGVEPHFVDYIGTKYRKVRQQTPTPS